MLQFAPVAALLPRWRERLTRTSQRAFGRLVSVLSVGETYADTWDHLEAVVILADVSVTVAHHVTASMQHAACDEGQHPARDLLELVRAELRGSLLEPPQTQLTAAPLGVLVVRVKSSGKTTTIAKLVRYFQKRRNTVLLGAADTFRAAAENLN